MKRSWRRPYAGSQDFLTRFWAHVERVDSGCMEWRGHIDDRPDQGYGTITLRRTVRRAHRVALELVTGIEIPADQCGCHRCDNPKCVNPEHVFIGTVADNNADCIKKGRHVNARLTHCRRGHPLTPDNLTPDRPGVRRCRTCTRQLAMKNYHLRRGETEKAAAWAP